MKTKLLFYAAFSVLFCGCEKANNTNHELEPDILFQVSYDDMKKRISKYSPRG